MKVKDIVIKVLATFGIQGKTAIILQIVALVCGLGARAATKLIDDEKTERMITEAVTEKLAELAEQGVINLTIKQQ